LRVFRDFLGEPGCYFLRFCGFSGISWENLGVIFYDFVGFLGQNLGVIFGDFVEFPGFFRRTWVETVEEFLGEGLGEPGRT
jgi:hypothetical protein